MGCSLHKAVKWMTLRANIISLYKKTFPWWWVLIKLEKTQSEKLPKIEALVCAGKTSPEISRVMHLQAVRTHGGAVINMSFVHVEDKESTEVLPLIFGKMLQYKPPLRPSVLSETPEGDLTLVGTKGCCGEQTPSHRAKHPLQKNYLRCFNREQICYCKNISPI